MSLEESKQGKSVATAIYICWKRPQKRNFSCRWAALGGEVVPGILREAQGTNQAVTHDGIEKQLL